MIRKLKNFYKAVLVKLFHFVQRLGFDVLPRHFYSEIPAIHRLRETTTWRKPYSMLEVAGANSLDDQLQFVRTTVSTEITQSLQEKAIHRIACERNGAKGYGPIEAEMLYAFVRRHRPGQIVQVGCGVSTAICIEAAQDAGYQPKITCIDPYPTGFLSSAAANGQIALIQKPIEVLDYEFLNELDRGDLFFIDSTHTLGPAGEVSRIVLEMLPRLAEGTFVHFHDIWFPYDYSPRQFHKLFFWHETALLHAFLCLNHRFRVLVSMSQLHHGRLVEMRDIFPRYQPMQTKEGITVKEGDYPSSIFLAVDASRQE